MGALRTSALRDCYQCGYTPCMYERYIARGDIESCLVGPRPWTVASWGWHALYDAAVAQGLDGSVANDATAAIRAGARASDPLAAEEAQGTLL